MNIILLNGSPRKTGATATALSIIQQELAKQNRIKAEIVHIADINMDFCRGCSQCFKTGQCFMQDDAEALSQRIAQGDGVIIGSPTYESNISGQLKTLLDRGHFVMEQLLHGKAAMSIAVGENYGISTASAVLRRLLVYSGARASQHLALKIPFATRYTMPPHIHKKLVKAAARYAAQLDNPRGSILARIVHFLAFHAGIKPFTLARGEAYAGVVQHWQIHRK